ncbi:DUF485 domain-containing protein [Lederbergia wuyishanensis]|uniref:Uncharacterized membrane protein (DUF485 family) n=1 Tax=Lederbergia wuyishanensis TaxID=1347903 RepID=A0ABU0D5U1_9BACI|nr:DUF485 domain-containing protein [Lederbergia wuyishanensis]MCJ8008362.1 DUF485 domain-containing protein [Lederbergia wuyishanensis]MDQ0343776.1 uncharacterized membrane protein (DUF485 family) [Lederbergia wuyishanensis]
MAKTAFEGTKLKKVEDFERIERSAPFQELLKAKRKFLVPSIILFVAFYLLFPILISYTDIMDRPAIGDISWAWIYALLLFVMTWTLATIYMKKAVKFDNMVEDVWKETNEGRKAQ